MHHSAPTTNTHEKVMAVADVPPLPNGPDRMPVEIDTTVAHEARVYDYLLGGTVNFEVDREAAMRAAAAVGGIETARASVRGNRTFLAQAVRYLVTEAGIRQFLDIGTGIPSADNVADVAHTLAPDARVVYVDNDPIVLAYAHELLRSTPEGTAAYIEGDLREPEDILRRASATLDLDEPVGLILVAVLHHITDDQDPYGLVARLVDALASGSYLVVTQLASDLHREGMTALSQSVPDQARYSFAGRSYDEVARFFEGLELVDPGLVPIDQWRPEDLPEPPDPARPAWHYGAIGRKP